MNTTEATKKLGEIFDNLTDEEQKEAIRVAIRARQNVSIVKTD